MVGFWCGGGTNQARKISLIFSASAKSLSLMPFTLWVFRSMTTLFHTLHHSGWWFMASATRATRVMLPNAATKSLQVNSLCSLPLTMLHPAAFGSSAAISASESFFAGIGNPPGPADLRPSHYAFESRCQQQAKHFERDGALLGP